VPPPKDPQKLVEYILGQRLSRLLILALDPKISKGHKRSSASIEKWRATMRPIWASQEYRLFLSNTCKENGNGKWMTGKKCPGVSKRNKELRTNKTYEELYGNRAVEEAIKRAEGNIRFGPRPKTEEALQIVRESNRVQRKDKTYTEIYGSQDRALEETKKRKDAHERRWAGKHRKFDDRPYQGGEAKYHYWRTDVFKRDDYTCLCCGIRGGQLNAHHILHWETYPLSRYVEENGATLCAPCHRNVHNAINMFVRFMKKLETLKFEESSERILVNARDNI